MSVQDMNVPAEVIAQLEKASSFNLEVPVDATKDKRGVSTWPQLVVVEDTKREYKEGKEGQKRVTFMLKTKVLAFGDAPQNVGRYVTLFPQVNFGWLHGDTDSLAGGDGKKETTMNAMSMKKIRQIAVAAGLDMTAGFTQAHFDALFPETGDSLLKGTRFLFMMTNNPGRKNFRGEDTQDVDSITPAGEVE